jgi:hypothetical protein
VIDIAFFGTANNDGVNGNGNVDEDANEEVGNRYCSTHFSNEWQLLVISDRVFVDANSATISHPSAYCRDVVLP